ncbi:C4-type zinc ribbon domain-containing protein [Aneurinibacillus sp. Ricciae_BoGa-3]|uniref:C4-type zinc ribbon domain-containing protein n=1 Tax=Aneurinibacillus sp. Ricciae_BoGa-3 TaxID=3022697 RepID=UPI00234161C8|nr:C4-type zinc ribbon domain-containing protein [Aneurinibacillus sp. Ricciae_BoGa-3]WCK53450.1 C4-type zinc ribbon domain-containing protein [Aneurinibacillus sp. Ricciae_BoGa-3]
MLQSRKLLEWHAAQAEVDKIQKEIARIKEEETAHTASVQSLREKVENLGAPAEEDIDGRIALALAQQELWMAEKEYERFNETVFDREMDARERLREWKDKAVELAGSISPEAFDIYHTVAQTKRNPIVEVKRRSCMGCFLPLSVAKMDEWRKGRHIVQCEECGRILV